MENNNMQVSVASKEEIQSSIEQLAHNPPRNGFVAKITASSRVVSSCEEFNVWHANADKSPDRLPWGELASPDKIASFPI